MEKRRRARINESLGQLKTLILDALKKDVSLQPSVCVRAVRLQLKAPRVAVSSDDKVRS